MIAVKDGDNHWVLDDDAYEINDQWRYRDWSRPIQLVLCVSEQTDRVSSCGTYRRRSDGKVGEIVRERLNFKVKVVKAANGKTLTTTTLLGSKPPKCKNSMSLDWRMSRFPPPWRVSGDYPSDAKVNAYAVKVSTGAQP